jgi:hypothetical protein
MLDLLYPSTYLKLRQQFVFVAYIFVAYISFIYKSYSFCTRLFCSIFSGYIVNITLVSWHYPSLVVSLVFQILFYMINDCTLSSSWLCKVKRSLPCYNDQQTDLTSFVHALVYNSSFYKGNSHQSIQFYP